MKLIFIMTQNFAPDFYLKLAKFAEELDFEVVGFFNFKENSEVPSTIENYPLYPWTYALKLNYDIAVVVYSGEEDEIIFANKTWTSEGYMVFIYGGDIFDVADFRRGIVYAEN